MLLHAWEHASHSPFRKATDTQARNGIRRGFSQWSGHITKGANPLGNSKQIEEIHSPVGKPVRQTFRGSLPSYLSQDHSESRILLPVILAIQNQSDSLRFWVSLILEVRDLLELKGNLFPSSILILTFLFLQPISQSRTLWSLTLAS